MDFTIDDVINIFASALNVKQDLIKQEFDDLENIEKDEFFSTIKDFASSREEAKRKTLSDRFYKRAKREEREKAEKELSESLGIEKKALADMIEDLKDTKLKGSEDAPNEKTTLTKEDIKKHPEFLNAVKEIKDQLTAKETEILELQKARKGDKVNAKLEKKVLSFLESSNADLGDDPATREKRIKQFTKLLKLENNFDLDEDGNDIVIVDENGELLRANEIDPLSFEEVAQSNWTWDFKKEEQTSSSKVTSPKENNFNKTKVNFKGSESNDPEEVFKLHAEALKEGNKDLADSLQEKLLKM